MEGTRLSNPYKGEACPNPFRAPPSRFLVEAQKLFSVPKDFRGRAGALVFEKAGVCYALYALKPTKELPSDYRCLSEGILWPAITLDTIADAQLFDASGNEHSFRAFLTERLNAYTAKDAFSGGKKLAWRKGVMLYAMKEALSSPAVTLLNAFNRERTTERLVSLGEWQVGVCDAYDIRFDSTFYSPLSSGKELVNFLLKGHALAPLEEEPIREIPILFEDKDLLIASKPPRLPSIPAAGEKRDCLTELSRDYGTLFDVHRLDMATSGVIVYARNRATQRAMQELFRTHTAKKEYVALLAGDVKERSGVIRLPLGVNRLDRPRQCVLPVGEGGKPAETYFEVLEKSTLQTAETQTLVRLVPITGRTHQLRVHCAHKLGLKIPIFCDTLYSPMGLFGEAVDKRLHLHAEKLSFRHPTTGNVVEVVASRSF